MVIILFLEGSKYIIGMPASSHASGDSVSDLEFLKIASRILTWSYVLSITYEFIGFTENVQAVCLKESFLLST